MKSSGWWIVLFVVLGLSGIAIGNRMQNATVRQPIEVVTRWYKSDGVIRVRTDHGEAGAGSLPNAGFVPLLEPDNNASTRSVAEAIDDKSGKLAHRLTSLISAPDFDRVQFEKDPDTYLNTIEPGRIWQSLEPAEGIVPINRTSDFYVEVLQGEKINLETKTDPKVPVTFYSPKLGQFSNGLSMITVRADENGVARAAFLASSGTRGEIDILASSPLHSGQARFLINVVIPGHKRSDAVLK